VVKKERHSPLVKWHHKLLFVDLDILQHLLTGFATNPCCVGILHLPNDVSRVDWPRFGSEPHEQGSNLNRTKCSGFGSAKSLNLNLIGGSGLASE
jgi:hypothetical protein